MLLAPGPGNTLHILALAHPVFVGAFQVGQLDDVDRIPGVLNACVEGLFAGRAGSPFAFKEAGRRP